MVILNVLLDLAKYDTIEMAKLSTHGGLNT
jgi:hypothetical protein